MLRLLKRWPWTSMHAGWEWEVGKSTKLGPSLKQQSESVSRVQAPKADTGHVGNPGLRITAGQRRLFQWSRHFKLGLDHLLCPLITSQEGHNSWRRYHKKRDTNDLSACERSCLLQYLHWKAASFGNQNFCLTELFSPRWHPASFFEVWDPWPCMLRLLFCRQVQFNMPITETQSWDYSLKGTSFCYYPFPILFLRERKASLDLGAVKHIWATKFSG